MESKQKAMIKQEYIEESEKLFNAWKNKSNSKSFVTDGIVDPDIWFGTELEYRVLIILREAYIKNGNPYDWDLTKWLKNEICCSIENCPYAHNCSKCKVTGSTYNRVAEWIYGIIEGKGYCSWLGIKDNERTTKAYRERRKEQFKKAAIINIKKHDGISRSSAAELVDIASDEKDGKYLKQQIQDINPNIIICGGTKSCLDKLCENDSKFANFIANLTVVDSPHPNAHKKAEEMFNDIYQQLNTKGE